MVGSRLPAMIKDAGLTTLVAAALGFFIVGFRHAELVAGPADVSFLQELELDRLVHSRPSPLNHCPIPVALTFVAVARRYQLVWCREMVELGRGYPPHPRLKCTGLRLGLLHWVLPVILLRYTTRYFHS